MHPHCATLFRHRAGLTEDTSDNLIELALLDHIVGFTASDVHAGRFPNFDYEGVHSEGQRIDIESLWSPGDDEGCNNFDWHKWKSLGLEWTAVRPDVYVAPI